MFQEFSDWYLGSPFFDLIEITAANPRPLQVFITP